MARRVSSSSCRRARSSIISVDPDFEALSFRAIALHVAISQTESRKHTLAIGEIPHQSPQGKRKFLNERRRRDNLVLPGEARLLVDIDDFKIITSQKKLLADRPDVQHRPGGTRRGAGDIQPKFIANRTVWRWWRLRIL